MISTSVGKTKKVIVLMLVLFGLVGCKKDVPSSLTHGDGNWYVEEVVYYFGDLSGVQNRYVNQGYLVMNSDYTGTYQYTDSLIFDFDWDSQKEVDNFGEPYDEVTFIKDGPVTKDELGVPLIKAWRYEDTGEDYNIDRFRVVTMTSDYALMRAYYYDLTVEIKLTRQD